MLFGIVAEEFHKGSQIMQVNIEEPREVLICVKGVPVCYVHSDGSITYLSQIVSILSTYFSKPPLLLFIFKLYFSF